MTAREATVVERLVDATVGPGAELPPVAETDAVAAFAAWLGTAPRTNRLAVRALLRAVDLRLRRLDRASREQWIAATRSPAIELLRRLAAYCYYGDETVMRRLGYRA